MTDSYVLVFYVEPKGTKVIGPFSTRAEANRYYHEEVFAKQTQTDAPSCTICVLEEVNASFLTKIPV